MNILPDKIIPGRMRRITLQGFTLAEIMITLAVFSLAMIAMVTVQIFGLKVYTLSSTKLIATTGGRQLLNQIRDPIRSGSTVMVGNYSGSFSPISSGSLQVGNALLISSVVTNVYSTTNSTVFYHDATSGSLCRIVNNVAVVVANNITNDLCFQAEDWQGNVLSSYLNNPVIRIDLGFIQWNFSGGSSGYYNLYHLQTRVARRPK